MKNVLLISSLFILPLGSIAYGLRDDIYKRIFGTNRINKDETRFNSKYYGLNWGSRTDEIVLFIIYFSY